VCFASGGKARTRAAHVQVLAYTASAVAGGKHSRNDSKPAVCPWGTSTSAMRLNSAGVVAG